MARLAPFSPVADWLAEPLGDGYGNYRNLASAGGLATVTRAGVKTCDLGDRIVDVPENFLAVRPRSDGGRGYEAVIEEARTNLLLNSYGAANTAGKWDGWNPTATASVGFSIVQGIYGSTAQRGQITAGVGDVDKFFYFLQDSAVGTFAAGENGILSMYIKGIVTGTVPLTILIAAKNSAGGAVGATQAAAITLTSSWQRVNVAYSALPATTSFLRVGIGIINGIDSGDTVDTTFELTDLQKGAFPTSTIPTTTAAATRNLDNIASLDSLWTTASGTGYIVRSTTYGGSTYEVAEITSGTIQAAALNRSVQRIVLYNRTLSAGDKALLVAALTGGPKPDAVNPTMTIGDGVSWL